MITLYRSGWRFDSTWVTIGFVWTKCIQIFFEVTAIPGIYWNKQVTTYSKRKGVGKKGPMGFQHHIWRAQDDCQQYVFGEGEHFWGETLLWKSFITRRCWSFICAAFRKILIGTTVEGAMDEARSPRCGVWKRRIQGGKKRCILPQWSFFGGFGMFVELCADL